MASKPFQTPGGMIASAWWSGLREIPWSASLVGALSRSSWITSL
jgi:hypothetical protein